MALIKNMTVCVAGVAAMEQEAKKLTNLQRFNMESKWRQQAEAIASDDIDEEFEVRRYNKALLARKRNNSAKSADKYSWNDGVESDIAESKLKKQCEALDETKLKKQCEALDTEATKEEKEADLTLLMQCADRKLGGKTKQMVVDVLKTETFKTEYEQSFYNTLRITTNYIAKSMNEKAEKMKFKIVNDKFEVRFVVEGKEEKEPRFLNIPGTFASKFKELFGDRATVELGNIDVVDVISCAKGKKMEITFNKEENKYTSKSTKMEEDDKCDDL